MQHAKILKEKHYAMCKIKKSGKENQVEKGKWVDNCNVQNFAICKIMQGEKL